MSTYDTAIPNAAFQNCKEDYSVRCAGCGTFSKDCKSCSRCKTSKYCSKKCQQDAFHIHKQSCKTIRQYRTTMEHEERMLRSSYENPWDGGMGHFWGLVDPRDYCRARTSLAFEQMDLANKEKNPYAYQLALANFLELMRMSHGDNIGCRFVVPFLLLALDRKQDCYDFIKWWATIDPIGRYDWGDPPENLQEGEWQYLRDQDILEDLFKDKRVSDQYFPNQHLLALVFLKSMIIDDLSNDKVIPSPSWDQQQKTIQKGFQDTKLATQGPALDRIHHFSVQAKQQELFDKYCNMLDKGNKFILKALCNPEPIMKLPPPPYISHGSIEEARSIMEKMCNYESLGVVEKLQAKFGDKPHYKAEFDEKSFMDF